MKQRANRTAVGLAILRVAVGIIFFLHGYQKLFLWGHGNVAGAFAQMGIPFPEMAAWLAAVTEFAGGLALALGLFTRLAALPVAFTMLVALVEVHLKGGFFLPSGFEYVLALLAATVAIAVAGPGAFALDNLRQREGAVTGGTYAIARN